MKRIAEFFAALAVLGSLALTTLAVYPSTSPLFKDGGRMLMPVIAVLVVAALAVLFGVVDRRRALREKKEMEEVARREMEYRRKAEDRRQKTGVTNVNDLTGAHRSRR